MVYPSSASINGRTATTESDSDEEEEEEEEDEDESESWKRWQLGRLPSDFIEEVFESDSEEEAEDSDDEDEPDLDLNKLVGKSAVLTTAQLRKAKDEIRITVKRALAEGHLPEDCFAELKTTKMAENMGWSDVRAVVVEEVLGVCVREGVKSGLKWGSLLGMLVLEKTRRADTVEVLGMLQVRLLGVVKSEGRVLTCLIVQDHLAGLQQNPSTLSTKILVPLIKHLYDSDILEEEAILAWWDSSAKRKGKDAFGVLFGEAHEKIRRAVEPLVRWLQEAEEDSEDDDSDEE
jgi:translation initiation factor eIF-2B subunit epsilon